jgi:hypothetical protein
MMMLPRPVTKPNFYEWDRINGQEIAIIKMIVFHFEFLVFKVFGLFKGFCLHYLPRKKRAKLQKCEWVWPLTTLSKCVNPTGPASLAPTRNGADNGKCADAIGLGKKEGRSPKNAAAAGAAESAGPSGDCIAAMENNSPVHVDRAPDRNDESQDKRISVLASQRIGRRTAAVDQIDELIICERSSPTHVSCLAPRLNGDVKQWKLHHGLELGDEIGVEWHFASRTDCLRRDCRQRNQCDQKREEWKCKATPQG